MTPAHRGKHPGAKAALVALLDGQVVGTIRQHAQGKLSFSYDPAWRRAADAYPISLSMPLTASDHGHTQVNAFLWGLLPDNHHTLGQYGKRFHVSSQNPVALLTHMGADCAGAIQFAAPEHVDALLASDDAAFEGESLSDADIARDLRSVRTHGVPSPSSPHAGQFSVAGAQPKIALLETGGRWARPSGRTPTNRILKPPAMSLPGFAENEHLCLSIAAELGMAAARSAVRRFEDEIAIVVERYDRVEVAGRFRRIHQEDFCQASAILPDVKYEADGGPDIAMIVATLRDYSTRSREDVDRFLDSLILAWLLAATDTHAKNYSLLLAGRGNVRLAPLYDIESYLPYDDDHLHGVKLAMSIGGEYELRRINKYRWAKLARKLGMDEAQLLARARELATAIPSAAERAAATAFSDGLDHDTIALLVARVQRRAASCLLQLSIDGTDA